MLRKSVKGKLILQTAKSSSILSLLAAQFDQSFLGTVAGQYGAFLPKCSGFSKYFKLFYAFSFFAVLHVVGLPSITFLIVLGNIYAFYLLSKSGNVFKRWPRQVQETKELLAVSIAFDSLTDRPEVDQQVQQFQKDTENLFPVIKQELLSATDVSNGVKISSPLILSFPPSDVELVKSVLQHFASLEVKPKICRQQISAETSTMKITKYFKHIETFLVNCIPVSDDSRKIIHNMIDQSKINRYGSIGVFCVYQMVKNFQSAHLILNIVMGNILNSDPRRQSETVGHVEMTRGFCDPLPQELIELLKKRTAMSSETLVLTILSLAFSSYFRLIRGEYNGHLNVSYGDWEDIKAQIKLPLTCVTTDNLSLFLDHVNKLESKTQDFRENFRHKLLLLEEVMPSHWYGKIEPLFRSNKIPDIEIQNIYLYPHKGSMFNPLVKSLYLWNESELSKLRILVTHNEKGITFTLTGVKNGPIESASLLAECIVKSVTSLCCNLNIKWDRRSPPSTPTAYDEKV